MRKVGVEIATYNPMVFLLGSIAVEHLYLNARQIVGHDVAWHEDGFGTKVVHLLHGVGPSHAVSVSKAVYLLAVNVPQHLVRQFVCRDMLLNRVENVNGVFVLTEKNYFHVLYINKVYFFS